MRMPRVDEELTLLTPSGQTKAICTDARDDPSTPGGAILKVMARGSFEEGDQCWIIDRDGSKIGATVEEVVKQTIDSELTLSAVLGA